MSKDVSVTATIARAKAALDALDETLAASCEVDTTVGYAQDAFGLAYSDGTMPEHGYQPAEARKVVEALTAQTRELAQNLLKHADTLVDIWK